MYEGTGDLVKRPNFFIIGAPRSGTTSMYRYLLTHPAVFMPTEKEPHYFATDLPERRRVTTESEYLEYFAGATDRHKAVGEASTWYLFSKEAVSHIRRFNPGARLLVFFRNPIDFVQSLQAIFAYDEAARPDFDAAWRRIRSGKGADLLIEAGMFGRQFRRLLEQWPRERVLPVLLEDLTADPRREYLRVLECLDLDDNGFTSFEQHNANRVHRSRRLAAFVSHTPWPVTEAWRAFKRLTGISRIGLGDRLTQMNSRAVRREPLSAGMRSEILEVFQPDIALLGELLGRDLSHWR